MSNMEKIICLAELILTANKTVVFTGAGISTSSGYPDLEGMQKITQRDSKFHDDLLKLLTNRFAQKNPAEFYRLYRKTHFQPQNRPSLAHRVMTLMQKKKLLAGIITMNLDHLHTSANSKDVVEYWGSINDNYCVAAHHYFDMEFIASHSLPRCPLDGSLVLPIFVERNMTAIKKELERGQKMVNNADLLLLCGTKAAHGVPGHPRKMVIINKWPTSFDSQAELVIHADLDWVFKQLAIIFQYIEK
ncbi:SIR2 family NAD-dependent protein deacylase [Liquorilactobacillus uvarum]|uniref:protein acetyllysine N-acetyltransferase n=1 Tax=Liquorilactobacillus uvarum DSM 19971 TaxID=1423812 RepID=A0A0R1Q9F9_9LACO|nr:Sir2 family NAD-dependent protein deacetylase [Liquorilactobacillus uvarum]KRL37899.1 NAD-dependent deacetylase [Liquorilactobacillus uvarum DSM 19971]